METVKKLPFLKSRKAAIKFNPHKYFPKTYEDSRQRFRDMLPELRKKWPEIELHTHPLEKFPQITIDWFQSAGTQSADKMLLFTTAEHGIEGYVGAAMLEYFFQKYLPLLDPATTGITLVHAINPWGMKNLRRSNSNNVDLNRNFVSSPDQLEHFFNPDYGLINTFLGPRQVIKRLRKDRAYFLFGYLAQLVKVGRKKFWAAKILGQYTHPMGLHFGGLQIQEEVAVTKGIYRQAFKSCSSRLVHLDMHTGYGPRYQMTLVNSVLEDRTSAEIKKAAAYPRVAAMNPKEFYEVRGDMIDYVYQLRNSEFPEVALYATSFEFGTFGVHPLGKFRSLLAMMQENQQYWFGTRTNGIKEKVRVEFRESFSPSAGKWRRKAVTDADQAFRGILKMEGFI